MGLSGASAGTEQSQCFLRLCCAYQVVEETNHEDWELAGVVKDAPLRCDERGTIPVSPYHEEEKSAV